MRMRGVPGNTELLSVFERMGERSKKNGCRASGGYIDSIFLQDVDRVYKSSKVVSYCT